MNKLVVIRLPNHIYNTLKANNLSSDYNVLKDLMTYSLARLKALMAGSDEPAIDNYVSYNVLSLYPSGVLEEQLNRYTYHLMDLLAIERINNPYIFRVNNNIITIGDTKEYNDV